ncbi:MAG: hypothetical protein P8010_21390 [Desulfosarcinaceae bacterium]|jgi:hypothetical protein
MIFIIRLHILFGLILLVLCSPPPIYRAVALISYLYYFRFFLTRYRIAPFGHLAKKAPLHH